MRLIINYLVPLIAAVIAITVHEYTKALTSSLLGDKLPANNGKLTINPLKHLDGLGLLMMYSTTFTSGFGVGFGKPTQTSALYYKNRKAGTIITYLMPIVVNILLGILIAIISLFLPSTGTFGYLINETLITIAKCSVSLGIYNLIPIYPLSGEFILNALRGKGTLSLSSWYKFAQYLFLFFSLFGYLNIIIKPLVGLFIGFAY